MSENTQEPTYPRYPKCEVTLLNTSSNSFSIIGKVRRGLERHLRSEGKTPEEIDAVLKEFRDEATSGGPDDVLTTAFRWVEVN